MPLSLDDLTTPVTTAQAREAQYATLAAVGTDTTSWKPGAVVRTMIAAMAIIIAAFSEEIARIARLGFLSLSSGEWLSQVARHVYGTERIEATFATGAVTLTNTGGGVFSLDPDDLILSNTTTGKTYRNTAAFTLGAMTSVTISVRASEAGIASSAAAGDVDALVTPLIGVTTIANALSFSGADAESDEQLRSRCLEMLGSLSPMGPWDAYSYAARTTTRADGSNVGVTRVRIQKSVYGNVSVYVAKAAGGVTDSDDMDLLDDAIQRRAVPLAVTAGVISATELGVPITYEAWAYESSRTPGQIETAIETALNTFIASQPIGGNVIGDASGKIFGSSIRAAIVKALPEIFYAVVTLPAGDVTMTLNQVAVLGAVTPTAIHREPTPEGTIN